MEKYFNDLFSWSKNRYDYLPWRKNRTTYKTLVSEIMLQQTTVSTVLNHFENFITKYPDIKTLAKCSEDEILIAWKGLGYYRRAKNLLHIAKEIEEKFDGKIPENIEELQSLKGVGSYTANAIVAIGLNQKGLALDANLERVLARYYGIKIEKGPKLLKEIQNKFGEGKILKDIAKKQYRMLNEALMDLGRVTCTKRKAHCHICPLSKGCFAKKNNLVLEIPYERTSKKEFFSLSLLRVLVVDKNKILATRKQKNEWLAGQYEIPTFILSSDDKKLNQYEKVKFDISKLKFFKTSITKYKITNYILPTLKKDFVKKISSSKKYEFVEMDSNLSTASLKAIKKNREKE